VQLLQALAPVAGRHVSKLILDVRMHLGDTEVEAIAAQLAGSVRLLFLGRATLLDSFWRPLAQHFPNLRQLCLDTGIKADAMNLAVYLAMSSASAPQGLAVHIDEYVFREEDSSRLKACVHAWGLENITLRMSHQRDRRRRRRRRWSTWLSRLCRNAGVRFGTPPIRYMQALHHWATQSAAPCAAAWAMSRGS
jgi:hypothetical protein